MYAYQSKPIKETAYKSLVRPQVEYSSTLWDPRIQKLKHKLEMVQRRSARWVYNQYRYGPKHPHAIQPSAMISELGWVTLETRRRWARLALMYKMVNNLVNMSYRTLLVPYPYTTQLMPLGALTPMTIPAAPLYFNTSFFPQTVQDWNSMLVLHPTIPVSAPAGVDAAKAFKAFKASMMAVAV